MNAYSCFTSLRGFDVRVEPEEIRRIVCVLQLHQAFIGLVAISGLYAVLACFIDHVLWAESYDRDMKDVLTLQSELAHSIARKIKVQLSPEERSRLAAPGRVDPQAHEDYLKGRYCLNKRTEKELDKAIRYFESAVEKDPRYAVAYSGLSDAYTLLSAGGYGANSPEDVIPKARDAALTALDIDDTLADAHVSLGLLKFNGRRGRVQTRPRAQSESTDGAPLVRAFLDVDGAAR